MPRTGLPAAVPGGWQCVHRDSLPRGPALPCSSSSGSSCRRAKGGGPSAGPAGKPAAALSDCEPLHGLHCVFGVSRYNEGLLKGLERLSGPAVGKVLRAVCQPLLA